LHVAQRHPGIQCGSDERMSQRVGRDGLADPGAPRDFADDPASAVPGQPPPVGGQEYRPVRSVTDGQVDRPGRARRQRYRHDFATLTGDRQGAVTALYAQVLDIGAGSLGDPQPVQDEQRDQRMLGWRA